MTENNTYTQSAWSLDDLFSGFDDPQYEAAFETIRQGAAHFQAYRDQLTPEISEELFLSIITEYERFYRLISRVGGFAELAFAANTQDQTAQTQVARVDQFGAEISNQTLFFRLWWKALDEGNAERLLAAAGDYRYWLDAMRNFKQYTLTESEEKVINIKDVTGVNALNLLYESIANRYMFKIEIDGEQKELTRGEVQALVREPDPDLRERAYRSMFSVYQQDAPILGQIFQAIVRDWRNENLNLRGFKNPISVRNLINDIPDAVVDILLEVTQKNVSHFQRFFRLKAKRLGVEKLRRYDIYAPVEKSDKKYPFKQAAELVLESFYEFDPRFARMAKEILDAKHVDSEVRKGKMSGAFCATLTPDLAPWVLLNFQGKPDDVATMAHELGHGIHSLMAREHSAFTQHACLPLAETASTFGEMMLIDKLLAEETDQAVRRDLLFRQMDDSFATIIRQNYFALFEKEAHEMIAQGAQIDDLGNAYLKNLKQEFGDAVDVADEFRWEWTMIPHIYSVPFYVYAYAFGQLLVLSLYKQYKAEGEAFKPRYMEILAAGGSIAPVELLGKAGIDITQPAFWQGGYDVIAEMVRTLETLK